MTALIVGGVVVILVGIMLSGQGGKLLVMFRGISGLFVEDMAKTPKGAEAIYNEAIEVAETEYTKAQNVLRKVAGQLETAKEGFAVAEKKLKQSEGMCERLVASGKYDEAEIYAQERELSKTEFDAYKEAITKLMPMLANAQKAVSYLEGQLKKLRAEKTTTVNKMVLNQQLSAMYSQMDEIKSNDLEKMLGHVKDGLKESTEMAAGSQVVHDNKLSTKVAGIDREMQTSSYIEELKSKYNKK